MGLRARAWCTRTCTCRFAVINKSFPHFGAPYSEDRMSMHSSVTELWVKTLGHAYIRTRMLQLTAPEWNLRYIYIPTNVRLYSLRFWRTVAYEPLQFPTCILRCTWDHVGMHFPLRTSSCVFFRLRTFSFTNFMHTNLTQYEPFPLRTLALRHIF